MTEADFMRRAIEATRRGIADGQTPFGAVIAREGAVVAAAAQHAAGGTPTRRPTPRSTVNPGRQRRL